MPEQISKHPEVTIKVLKGAGARCGEGVEQKILTKCPAGRFCSLPTGEICVYGIQQIPQMTQITREDLAPIVCRTDRAESGWLPASSIALPALLLGMLVTRSLLGRRRAER